MGTNYNVSNTGSVRAGTTTNNVTIDSTGASFSGNARPTKRESISCTEFVDGTNPPASVVLGTAFTRNFDPTTSEYLHYNWTVPNDYESGTTVTIIVNWAPGNTNTGNVKWIFSRVVANSSDAISGSGSNTFITSAGPGVINDLVIQPVTTGITGAVPGTCVCIKFGRFASDVADTFTGDAKLVSISIEYTANIL